MLIVSVRSSVQIFFLSLLIFPHLECLPYIQPISTTQHFMCTQIFPPSDRCSIFFFYLIFKKHRSERDSAQRAEKSFFFFVLISNFSFVVFQGENRERNLIFLMFNFLAVFLLSRQSTVQSPLVAVKSVTYRHL